MNNKITFNDQDVAVSNFLKEKGITFNAQYGGVNNDPKWEADLFFVSFEKGANVYRTEFKTGTGHRVGRNGGVTPTDARELAKVGAKVAQVDQKNWTRDDYKRNNNKAMSFGYRVYVATPCAANVLYCLLADADCGSETHADFCANMGYDEDSRKGLEIYLACQKTGEELRKIFTGEELEALREMLEDY
ncbi:hypothetical protein X824_gp128 [Escherichia phage 4MG]|uniref:Hyphothetical protein n=1 Tax=Escherichia phage 4MG TaxID=1391428 RepID=V5KSP7_9CAUD|nr:hypothetical protein X824_gp128 [Escherichia phage 4MG]AGZ17695.1 hyphothetical protein [Escherichia phage 4MG]